MRGWASRPSGFNDRARYLILYRSFPSEMLACGLCSTKAAAPRVKTSQRRVKRQTARRASSNVTDGAAHQDRTTRRLNELTQTLSQSPGRKIRRKVEIPARMSPPSSSSPMQTPTPIADRPIVDETTTQNRRPSQRRVGELVRSDAMRLSSSSEASSVRMGILMMRRHRRRRATRHRWAATSA